MDIVERLRKFHDATGVPLWGEAADEIERLRKIATNLLYALNVENPLAWQSTISAAEEALNDQ